MDSSTLIWKLPPSHKRELFNMLEYMESWKRLMAIIPKRLHKGSYECPLGKNNLPKYTSDHFRKLEHASQTLHQYCAEILIKEWSSTGPVRPAVGHLLYLLTKAELYRAADYVAINILNQEAPVRPAEGPAALVSTSIEDISSVDLNSTRMEEILNSYDSQNVSDMLRLSDQTIRNNVDRGIPKNRPDYLGPKENHSKNHEHIVPTIFVSEPPVIKRDEDNAFRKPLVIENPHSNPHIRSSQNENNSTGSTSNNVSKEELSDMIKFSKGPNNSHNNEVSDMMKFSRTNSSENSQTMEKNSQIENTHSHNQEELPAISNLMLTSLANSEISNGPISILMSVNSSFLPDFQGLKDDEAELRDTEETVFRSNETGSQSEGTGNGLNKVQSAKIVLYPNMSDSIKLDAGPKVIYPNMTASIQSNLLPDLSKMSNGLSSVSYGTDAETDHSLDSNNVSLEINKKNGNQNPVGYSSVTENNIPALSALNLGGNSNIAESTNNPALSFLMEESGKIVLSDLSKFNASALMQNSKDHIPQLSALMSESSRISTNNNQITSHQSSRCIPLTIMTTEENSNDLPQVSLKSRKVYNPQTLLEINTQVLSKSSSTSAGSSKLSPITLTSGLSDLPSHSRLSPINLTTSSQTSSRPSCHSPLPNLSLNTSLPHFPFFHIEACTNNFNETAHKSGFENSQVESCGRFLGKGAFGSVYLALGLSEKPTAVKKLFLNNEDVVNVDDPVTRQFRNEVEILSRYKHEHLLSLLGYSCDGPTYCLLYEYISGGTLKDRLSGKENKLIWTDRLNISVGTANAVSYLHTAFNTPLVHRDIKSANILLDCQNKPKLGDFGLIKLITKSGTASYNTEVFGTSAYMAPEAFRRDVSDKLDTFSFGVVILELLTSLPPTDNSREGIDLITHIQNICDDIDIDPLLDKEAGTWHAAETNFAKELYSIANKCLVEKRNSRPTMVNVAKQLLDLAEKCPKMVYL